MPHENRFLLWLDLETTGDKPSDYILEAGWFFTDNRLQAVHPGGNSLVRPGINWKNLMIPVVEEMHKANGLTRELEAQDFNTIPLCLDVERQIMVHMNEVACQWWREQHPGEPTPEGPIESDIEFVLAGSGISQLDMPMLKRRMPALASKLMYFMLDIGQVRRFLRDIVGLKLDDEALDRLHANREIGHRARADALMHWNEAIIYAQVIERLQAPGWEQPGLPDPNEAPTH